ncbi:hypothetical protein G7046_g7292 [Stylonectria norvegica]|nr:hypothetical protein G7046_g7292 [Stylonectria norvegica]
MNDASAPQIYPRYCFHLSPTVNTWCFLWAAEIHDLERHAGFEGENFYFYKSLPIKWVRIVGAVVAIDEYAGRRIYTVDDSSGACIECMVTISPAPKKEDTTAEGGKLRQKDAILNPPPMPAVYADIDVGSIVDVKGGLSIFRDEKQINMEKMTALRSTAQEVTLWEKRARFRTDVLEKPWVLRSRDIRRCRKEAERSEEEAERKKKRLKALVEGHRKVGKLTLKTAKEAHQDGRRPGNTSSSGMALRRLI